MSADLIEKLLAKMKKTGSSDMLPPKMEPGEAPSSDAPPFPSYSIQPEHPIMTSAPRYPFVRPFAGGPIPAPGTPQDRFAAVLGRPRYSSLPAPLLGMALNTTTPFPPPSHQQSSAFGMHLAAPGVSTPGALSTPQPIPSLAAPAVHKPQVGPTGRSSNNGGGRGPTLPEPGAPVTTWLSFECQRRHFNPEFKTREIFTKDGRPKYQCIVTVKDIVIDSNTLFNDPLDAKAHVADKALKYIRREWPRNGLPASYNSAPGAATVKNQVEDLGRRQEELRQMLKQRQQTKSAEPLQNSPPVSSGVDMTDPAQARAFVEGFKVGQLAAQREAAGGGSSPPSIPPSRRRSRSPARRRSGSQGNADDSYRQRSPIRDATKTGTEAFSPPRYFDGSRHGM
ncbi:hypothetical protein J7T55_003146 [Diaporthe amygdali]|uniref:uncharacterized protein n=1 Tax=Phomopsis amygdali TaxID=1214568 RepID=UPI0022FECD77|nr:uncharacterized protein J7T55_003146 [Diaporthe amygdali]KAJ0122631.1 hypothetical protein J7T55_003146 [Diaporthe amygdali]